MSCPTSGGEGRGTHPRPARIRPRFQPTGFAAPGDSAAEGDDRSNESESSDFSEEQFAASLEASSAPGRRFVPGLVGSRPPVAAEEISESVPPAQDAAQEEPVARRESEEGVADPVAEASADFQFRSETFPSESERVAVTAALYTEAAAESSVSFPAVPVDLQNAENSLVEGPEWRQEVAARLHHYHSRRARKPPRYPSLALKFDPPAYSAPTTYAEAPRAAASAVPNRSEAATAAAAAAQEEDEPRFLAGDATNIIEFPRPLVPPPPRPDELAEPILDLPRILDAPESVPKQVPLGGIILHPEEAAPPSDLELPLPVAPLSRRILAAGLDGILVSAATLMFALIANKIASLLPSARVLLGLGVALPAVLWAVFQYVFLVYTGSTPGMRLSGLRLSDFDGSIPERSTRRWRALAMALSAVSLGLGFLWCLLDEDTLCWHDRITRTYLDAGPSAEAGPRQGPFFPQRFFECLRRAEAFLQRRDEETREEAGSLDH